MTDKDALELLNMFTTATQIAKTKNKYEFQLKMNEAVLTEIIKKAFPALKNDIAVSTLARNILNT